MSRKTKSKRNRCHNCKFVGNTFQLAGLSHCMCNHPSKKEADTWDRLQEFWDSCDLHEIKEKQL